LSWDARQFRRHPRSRRTTTPADKSTATRPAQTRQFLHRLPDNSTEYGTITLREASLFHERLMEVCGENGVGLSYGGVL